MAEKESKDLAKTAPAKLPWLSWDIKKWFEQAYGRPYSLAWLPELELTVPEELSSAEGNAEAKAKAAA